MLSLLRNNFRWKIFENLKKLIMPEREEKNYHFHLFSMSLSELSASGRFVNIQRGRTVERGRSVWQPNYG